MRQRLAANDRRPRPVGGQTGPAPQIKCRRVETSELRTPGEPWNLARCRAFSWVPFGSCCQIGRTGVEASEAYRVASNLGATGGRLGFNMTPWFVTSTRASG